MAFIRRQTSLFSANFLAPKPPAISGYAADKWSRMATVYTREREGGHALPPHCSMEFGIRTVAANPTQVGKKCLKSILFAP